MMLRVNSNKLKWTEARTSTKVLTVWPICPEINGFNLLTLFPITASSFKGCPQSQGQFLGLRNIVREPKVVELGLFS